MKNNGRRNKERINPVSCIHLNDFLMKKFIQPAENIIGLNKKKMIVTIATIVNCIRIIMDVNINTHVPEMVWRHRSALFILLYLSKRILIVTKVKTKGIKKNRKAFMFSTFSTLLFGSFSKVIFIPLIWC